MAEARIGLDMHVFDGLHQGSRAHCLELFSRVVALLPECHFVCLLDQPQQLREEWPAFRRPNVSLVRMPHTSAPRRLLWQLPQLARAHKLSLLHTQYIAPPLSPCAAAVTVHDILFEGHGQFFSRGFRLRSKLLVRRSARRAALLFTVSEYSRREIANTYGIPPARITVTANGADLQRFHPVADTQADTAALAAHGLAPGQYLLTVGRLEPRKNHARLLRAYAQLPPGRPRLVVVGERDFGYGELLRTANELQLGDDFQMMEKVGDDLLPLLYRNARLFVYPTLAEGFGMPVIEAMASGVPVLTSNTTALPEVGGDVPFYCAPEETPSIYTALCTALADETVCRDKAARGLARAATFSWDHSAEQLAAAYRRYLQLP